MNRLPVLFLLGTVLACLWASLAAAQDRPGPAGDQQILVMLRLPPAHLRPNADYAGDYGDGLQRAVLRRTAHTLAHRLGLTVASDWPMPRLGVDCVVMKLPAGVSARQAIERLSANPDVAWSQPLNLYTAQDGEPSHRDPLYALQPAASEWRLAALHRIATGRGIRVAVVDSRIETGHPDLAGQFAADENFVDGQGDRAEWHGTAVAGVIGAKADNGIGIAGVAPGARLLALRACWEQGAARANENRVTVCDSLSLALDFSVTLTHTNFRWPNDADVSYPANPR